MRSPRLIHVSRLALMYGIRFIPLPWRTKESIIHLLTPGAVVVSAAVIPDSDGRVLMLRTRYSGHWIPPGGAVHPGEDPLTGVRRECQEELGAEVEDMTLSGIYTIARTRVLYIVFRCAPLTAPPRLSEEHDAWRYVAPARLPARFRVMAEDALSGKPHVIRRLDE